MELTCVRVNSANATISTVITHEALNQTVEKLAKEAAKNVKIDGFRKGKVPLSIIKSRLGAQLAEDAKSEMVREAYRKGIAELGIDAERILMEPAIRKFEEVAEGIALEMALSLRPEIVLDGYEALIPDINIEAPSEDEVEIRILEMASQMLPFETVDEDRAIVKGDVALIDFEGFIDGEPFDGGKAERYPLEIGSNRFIAGFEEQIIGMKKGEQKEIRVTFPADYPNATLAGKEATFKVKLHEIQKKADVTLDDELAKKILPNDPDATLEKLKNLVKETIINEKKRTLYANDYKPALLDALLEKFLFDLPEEIVEREIDLLVRGKIGQMSEEEIEALKNHPEKIKELRDEVREEAAKSVRATFIIDELARLEGVRVSDQELVQAIYYEALSIGQDPKQMLEYYRVSNLLSAVKMAMIEDRLLGALLDKKLAS
ncbi:MAG: trigger factor [Campylobacterales bacterium]